MEDKERERESEWVIKWDRKIRGRQWISILKRKFKKNEDSLDDISRMWKENEKISREWENLAGWYWRRKWQTDKKVFILQEKKHSVSEKK